MKKTIDSNQEILFGIIDKDGYVKTEDGREFAIPRRRHYDKEGFPEVLIDAKNVGGDNSWSRQSIKPFIGMKCRFVTNNGKHGFNFEIIQ